ncbi:MAG: 16S rRNA (guanine(527)-N(7))-methyltransferase RsmG [Candidatus Methylopumilus sp.]|jgi:16S rRNA (guanine527-N7)-methyltransferase
MKVGDKKDRDLLIEGLQRMDLKLSDQVIDQLMTYLNLVEKWNRVYNLTAIRERDEMIKLHFLDSLSILNHVHVKNILDVGSGAGFPGIVLAITKPELKVTVMDSVNKKTTFMQQVKSELSLTNLDVVNSRVEDYQPTTLFEAVTSRAFSNLKNMMSLTQHTLQKEGVWLAMKSKDVREELEAFEKNQYTLIPLEVPLINAERYLVILKKDNF